MRLLHRLETKPLSHRVVATLTAFVRTPRLTVGLVLGSLGRAWRERSRSLRMMSLRYDLSLCQAVMHACMTCIGMVEVVVSEAESKHRKVLVTDARSSYSSPRRLATSTNSLTASCASRPSRHAKQSTHKQKQWRGTCPTASLAGQSPTDH